MPARACLLLLAGQFAGISSKDSCICMGGPVDHTGISIQSGQALDSDAKAPAAGLMHRSSRKLQLETGEVLFQPPLRKTEFGMMLQGCYKEANCMD